MVTIANSILNRFLPPHHPTHRAPNPSHRLRPIFRLEEIVPSRALHLQDPPILPRQVAPRGARPVGDEIEVAVVNADADKGKMVVEGREEKDLDSWY